jgi:hypothetical protein
MLVISARSKPLKSTPFRLFEEFITIHLSPLQLASTLYLVKIGASLTFSMLLVATEKLKAF